MSIFGKDPKSLGSESANDSAAGVSATPRLCKSTLWKDAKLLGSESATDAAKGVSSLEPLLSFFEEDVMDRLSALGVEMEIPCGVCCNSTSSAKKDASIDVDGVVTGAIVLERLAGVLLGKSFSLASSLNLCNPTFWKLPKVLGVERTVDFSGEGAAISFVDSKVAKKSVDSGEVVSSLTGGLGIVASCGEGDSTTLG